MLPTPKISIFSTLRDQLGDQLPIVRLTKATLVHLSHTLEDFVLRGHLPALVFTGFQESSHWRKETERYRQLSEVAMQVCIFAGQPLPIDADINALQIQLEGEDPLQQEWFLAILSTQFTVILCGLDNLNHTEIEAFRQFDTAWSFEVETVNAVLDVLEDVIQHYRPDMLPQLQDARRDYPPVNPNPNILTTFTQELLKFEDTLHREVTKQALEQERLRVTLEKERELNEMRHQLMITLAHELRTPMAIIQSSSELLDRYFDRLQPEKRQMRLQTITTQIERLKQVMDDIDIVVRSDPEQLRPNLKPIDLEQLCQDIVHDIQQSSKRVIQFRCRDNLQAVMIDPSLVRYIVSNLLSNAVKYSQAPTLIQFDLTTAADQVVFVVRDEGIGIPAGDLPHVMNAFYRASNVGVIGGTGLGLAIIQNSVTAYNGEIAIESKEGEGTMITIKLPLLITDE